MDDIRKASEKASEDYQDLFNRAFLGIQSLSYAIKSHRPRIRYVLARVHSAFQGQLDVNTDSVEKLMKTPAPGESGFHIDHIFPQSESKKEFWRQDVKKNDLLQSTSSRYQASIHSIGNLVLLHHEDNMSQSDALPWETEKIQNLAKSELYLNRALVTSKNWQQDERISSKLIELQSRRKILIEQDSWGENVTDQLASLYWNILSGEIKKRFGIKD
jgi:hypothetical protein